MNGIKMGLGITPGEHIISANSALSRNIRHCFCLSCRGRLILQTDAQGAWFEHDLHALSAQQKAACVGHCCKVSDEAAFCLIQRPYISKTLL
ncbi:zinc-ribbon domain-containing protein, partial [Escherichia coli]